LFLVSNTNTLSSLEKDTTTDISPIQTKKRNGKGNSKKLRYEGVYGPTLGPLEQMEAKKQSLRTPGRTTLKATGGGKKGKIDFPMNQWSTKAMFYSQAMQPFEEYFHEEAEKEKLRERLDDDGTTGERRQERGRGKVRR
jgi:hypothetical protein